MIYVWEHMAYTEFHVNVVRCMGARHLGWLKSDAKNLEDTYDMASQKSLI